MGVIRNFVFSSVLKIPTDILVILSHQKNSELQEYKGHVLTVCLGKRKDVTLCYTKHINNTCLKMLFYTSWASINPLISPIDC